MTAISIVMGTCNDATTLPETLDSVLGQSWQDFEFIVVDDGSTDERVQQILAEYQQRDTRIKPLRKRHEGLTRALIDGCKLAHGDYIARIDAGDVMLPGRLVAQAEVLDAHPDCAFVACWTEFCGPHWEPLWLARGAPSATKPAVVLPDDPEQGLLADVPHHGSVMFRRDAYERCGGYRAVFYHGQDWDLWYRLAESGRYHVVQQTLYRARFFPGSISMMRKRFQDESARCSKGAFVARRRGLDETEWLQRAQTCRPTAAVDNGQSRSNHEPGFYFIGEALRRRGDPRARSYLTQAMRQAPVSPRAYVRWLQSWIPKSERRA
jgi:glycosyltransferase involved in cell wall biosynthesis